MSKEIFSSESMRIEHEGLVATVNPLGAYVESLVNPDGQELLFPRQEINGKDRGGLPVCAPIFGPGEAVGLKQHGFARNLMWQRVPSNYPNEVILGLVSPRSQDETIPESYEGCAMQLRIVTLRLDQGSQLHMELKVRNFGPEPFVCAPGFHPYFPVEPNDLGQVGKIEDNMIGSSVRSHKYSLEELSQVQYPNIGAEALVINGVRSVTNIDSQNLPHPVLWSDNEQYFCVEPTASGVLDEANMDGLLLPMGGEKVYRMNITWAARA